MKKENRFCPPPHHLICFFFFNFIFSLLVYTDKWPWMPANAFSLEDKRLASLSPGQSSVTDGSLVLHALGFVSPPTQSLQMPGGEEAAWAQRGRNTEFPQETPLSTTSNNSFQLEEKLEICQISSQHYHVPQSASPDAWKLCYLIPSPPCWQASWAGHCRKPTWDTGDTPLRNSVG
jgi:hypothetical protein